VQGKPLQSLLFPNYLHALESRPVRRIVILGTYHELQGSDKRLGNVSDPLYSILLGELFESEAVNFVFEEASGFGSTTAERFANEILGAGCYLDVDPPLLRRKDLNISTPSNQPYMIGNPPDAGFANWQSTEVHESREIFWSQAIQGSAFDSGLMVCGIAHMLSFAFRLRAANFEVKAIDYLPRHKLEA
jgi:hypothetical protein